MTEQDPGALPVADAALRKRLMQRIAFAAGVIAVLLGLLVAYESYNRPEEAKAPPASEAPIAPRSEALAPAQKTAPTEEAQPPGKEVLAEPEKTAPLSTPARGTGPAPAPAPPGEASILKAAPEARKNAGEHPQPLPPPATTHPTGGAYLVQVGVFNNLEHAEDLRAKLTLAGIASQLEVRVKAGPYANRDEARRAIGQLHAMGIKTILLVPAKR